LTSKAPPRAAFLADLKGAHVAAEWRTDWSMALLYRRPGVELGYLASRLGLSPMAVTVLGLCVAISLPVHAALLPLWLAPLAVAGLALLFPALDCADGVLARATGQTSKRGGVCGSPVELALRGFLHSPLGALSTSTDMTSATPHPR